MKKKYIYILLVVMLLISIYVFNNNENKTFKIDEIKYAVSVNGQKENSFPEKAPYDVVVSCTNADGSWNYNEWIAEVYNIIGDVTCNIRFESKSTIYLNNHIKNTLTGTMQGNGQVVNEIVTIDNSTVTPTATLEQSNYTNLTNDATYPFSWDATNKTWTSTNKVDSTTSTITFSPNANGHYQVCYTQSSEQNYDYGKFYVDNVEVHSAKGVSGDKCAYLGNLTTSNVIKVTYQKDASSASGNDNIIFYLQSGTYTEKIEEISTGYRYEGKNPNNYVLFNDELWRIIGVFDETSHGQNGEYLTKIIREASIGVAFDKNGTNNWATSSLYNLLNGAYYNSEDGTDSGNCYYYDTTIPGTCDYRVGGIQEEYRSMVKNVTWYLGGYSSNGVTTYNMYTYERSSDDVHYYRANTSNKTTTGHIGLMYASDYGYSALSSSCSRTTRLSSYRTDVCRGNLWLEKYPYEFTITQATFRSDSIFIVTYWGDISNNVVEAGYATRPVLYLDSSVYIIHGDGSLTNPYIIDM